MSDETPEYCRMSPTIEGLMERLKKYGAITYGAPAYGLSVVEARLLVSEHNLANKRNEILREALLDISIGKKQEDIGMPEGSIGWRMHNTALKALKAADEVK